jgi:hypothetical protein
MLPQACFTVDEGLSATLLLSSRGDRLFDFRLVKVVWSKPPVRARSTDEARRYDGCAATCIRFQYGSSVLADSEANGRG